MMIREFGYKVFMENPAQPFLPCETLGPRSWNPLWKYITVLIKYYFILSDISLNLRKVLLSVGFLAVSGLGTITIIA